LIAKECDLQVLNGKLPDDTLIVCVDNYSTLSELYLTIMALKTGGKLYFVDDSLLPEETKKSIIIANSFTQELFACDGMGFLNSSCESMSSFERVEKRVENLSLRTAFSECIKATDRLTQNLFATTSNMFATVSVDDRCTACMGCAFVCKSSAFVASEEQGALLLNASLCTACGFCESVCPEKSISVTKNQISLKAEDFTHKVVAKDELFYCVECGKAFATKKAIEKVAGVFATLFMEEHKKRTLFCCADCKPKIMLQDMINQNAEALA
jgi:ferredoxin